jgi:hypothetical protein
MEEEILQFYRITAAAAAAAAGGATEQLEDGNAGVL